MDESLIKRIKHYQQKLISAKENNEFKEIPYYLKKLSKLPIAFKQLEQTGIGKTVNSLSKYDGEVGTLASALVNVWKLRVQEEIIKNDALSKMENECLNDNNQKSDLSMTVNGGEGASYSSNKVKVPDKNGNSSQCGIGKNASKDFESNEVKLRINSYGEEKRDNNAKKYNSVYKKRNSPEEDGVSSIKRPKVDEGKRLNLSPVSDGTALRKKIKIEKIENNSDSLSENGDYYNGCAAKIKREKQDNGYAQYESDVLRKCPLDVRIKPDPDDAEKVGNRARDDDGDTSSAGASDSDEDEDESSAEDESTDDEEKADDDDQVDMSRVQIKQEPADNSCEEDYYQPAAEDESDDEMSVAQTAVNRESLKSEKQRSRCEINIKREKNDSELPPIEHSKKSKIRIDSSSSFDRAESARKTHANDKHKRPVDGDAVVGKHSKSDERRKHHDSSSSGKSHDKHDRSTSRSDRHETSHSKTSSSGNVDHKHYGHNSSSSHKSSSSSHHHSSDNASSISGSSQKKDNKSDSKKDIHHHRHHHSSSSRRKESNDDKNSVTVKKEPLDDRYEKKTVDAEVKSSKHSASKDVSDRKINDKVKSSGSVNKNTVVNEQKKKSWNAEGAFGAALMEINTNAVKSPKKKSTAKTSTSSSTSTSKKYVQNESGSFLNEKANDSPLLLNSEEEDCDYNSQLARSEEKKKNARFEEEALISIMTTKNQKTKVYSGNKVSYGNQIPSLFDLCIRVLQDNIDDLEYTGGIPYMIIKRILEHASAEQLATFERYNPYIKEDSDELWEFHVKKHFRNATRMDGETWRDLYERCISEREEKFNSLKTNINLLMANSTPARKTKLAYINEFVKPPRDVAKKQVSNNTSTDVKVIKKPSSEPQPSAASIQAVKERFAAKVSQPAASTNKNQLLMKKKPAPLMQKALKLMKGSLFRR